MEMNRDRQSLPIFKEKDAIIDSVRKNPVTIIIGDTGCGKSTQVPQYLIGAGWRHIVCTQPRRLSTISLSERVAKEMYCEETGDVGAGRDDERRSATRSASRAAAAAAS